jgi:DNA-binding transcriptional regulator YiaG
MSKERPLHITDLDERTRQAIAELQSTITARYPTTLFELERSPEDPASIHLLAVADVDDPDEVGQTLSQRIPRRQRMALAALLRDLRQEAGLRQEDLAARLGTNQNAVSNLELGERRLDVLELRLLCAVLGISVEAFVTRLENALADNA